MSIDVDICLVTADLSGFCRPVLMSVNSSSASCETALTTDVSKDDHPDETSDLY